MNTFVESFATKQLLLPWVSKEAEIWGFVVRVPDNTVQRYLDAYLNGEYPDRAPYIYSTIPGPQIGLLNVAIHQNASSVTDDYPDGGWDTIKHTEVYWTYPVMRRRITADNLLVEPTLVWVEPFEFDDNAVAVFSGREIWGGDIGLATIVRHEEPAGGLHLDVALNGVRRFNARSVGELLACLHVRVEPGEPVDPNDLLKAKPELQPMAALFDVSALSSNQLESGKLDATHKAELNNLKQFRDANNPEVAIYRAIIASTAMHENIHGLVFHSADTVAVDFMWSDSIKDMVGDAFGLVAPPEDPPPPPDPPSDHASCGDSSDENKIYWNLARASLPVEVAYTFCSNATFTMKETLHTYGE